VRPVAELPCEGARGVVFDVDDTVTRDGVLEPEAFAALCALRARGMLAIAVTGRPLGWADGIAALWPVSAAVGENGAGWAFRRAGAIEVGWFDDAEARAAQAQQLARVRAAVADAMPDVMVASDQPARRCDLAFDVGERARLDAAHVRALAALIAREGARSMVSSVHAHAIPGAWDKARGVVRAAAALGLDEAQARRELVFVGDSGNDAAAFAFFERTVGVANVRAHLDRLPVPPRFVTAQDRGRGFAELVRHLLSEAD
jgi:HAD superfamily hydrolase (TIGR01484 family)